MDRIFAREYLAGIAALVKDSIHDAAVDDTDDGAVLYLTAASPFASDEEISYTVTFEDFKDDMCIFHTMIFVCLDVPEESFDGFGKVINALNARITVGSYIFYEEQRAVMFAHGFLLDQSVEINIAARILLRSIGLMENAVANTGEWLRSLAAGDCTADEIISQLEEIENREED